MKNWLIPTKILLTILLINNISVRAQNITDSLLFFEKQIFIGKDDQSKVKTYYSYVLFLKNHKMFQESRLVLNEATQYAITHNYECDSTSLKILYEMQLSSYYLKDDISFSITYNQIRKCSIKDEKILFYSELLNLFLFLDLGDLKEAQILANQLFKGNPQIDTLFKDAHTLHLKSIKKGKLLSNIPGLGQFYSGYPIEGTASFLLCGLLGTGLYISIVNEVYFLGGFAILPSFFRSWKGGKLYTENQINFTNQQKINNITEEIKKQILFLVPKEFN